METSTVHDHNMMTTHDHDSMTTHDHNSMTTEHDHSGMDSMDHMMMMYFHTGFKETILFQQWAVDSEWAMIGSCIGIFLMAVLYEGLKYFREMLHRREYVAIDYSKVSIPSEGGSGGTTQTRTRVSCQKSMSSTSHFIQTALHLLQLALSYALMLIVMTYNVWLCLSVILGCTTGYFLFGWSKSFMVDLTEHCH